MGNSHHNFVDGEWIAAETGETFENVNPADATRAVEAAVAAADGWETTPGPERGRILQAASERLAARKNELTEALIREEGKARPEAAGEVQRAVDIFAYYGAKARDFRGTVKAASSPDTTLYTVQEPMGVAALITPWNYPIAIPAWKLAPALATGNAVVFKPATNAPDVARMLVECLDDAGLPPGVVNMVTGPGSVVGSVFTEHEGVDAVSFTGSTSVGLAVGAAAQEAGKRVQLEMGGKNPTVVMPSADLERAVDIVASGAFGVTGQACTACSRAIVHEDVYDEFLEALVVAAESITVGPGLDGADMGPQVSADELQGTLEYIDIARGEGATLLTGGSRLTGAPYDNGHFVEPTVFADASPEMRISCEEVFGPVLAVLPVGDFEEAMEVANDVEFGLSASIVTQELTEANRFVDEIEAGVAKVNDKTTGLELHVPFGGQKASSSETYREQGDAGLEFYTLSKTVYMNY
ncbi:aldehyde dehydrogenase family protein [Salinigranum rubrum]|uniref:Aldehyde dehydrogenase family protein n=1 Tax=Salinigranum rubrum TaxID=755307 RepID=A0A2I8VKN7_9EURY|nr:aldehyde dehydrogenase family protein [Salinigranum rubrum]AUV82455.1 aldehyde dehydrogenase family protein [Salinigranum rubrum]